MRISRFGFTLATIVAAMTFAAAARANILINVDKSTQEMTVTVDGSVRYIWPVSTGAPGYDTPSGEFKPFRMEAEHFSREWDDAPMPHSIFFTMKGHAIHGSNHKSIGTPASHGCVRLEPKNASILFALVKQEHMSNTRVVLSGETPSARSVPVARRNRTNQRTYSNADDEDFTTAMEPPPPPVRRQRVTRAWREYNDSPRYYYYQAQPYAPPPRRYGGEPYYPYGR